MVGRGRAVMVDLPAHVVLDGCPEVDHLHGVEVEEEGHGGGEAEGELQPLGATVMHVLYLDVDAPLKGVPLPFLGISPFPYGLGRRWTGGRRKGCRGEEELGGGGGGKEQEREERHYAV